MFLFELDTENFLILLAFIAVAAVVVGWIADGVFGESGFGLAGNVMLCGVGAVGGLCALDVAMDQRMLAYHHFTTTTCVFAAAIGSAALLVTASLAKTFLSQ
ncbi:MAG: hypothetical protein AAGF59_13890 [Pseudomonadota bacterium]